MAPRAQHRVLTAALVIVCSLSCFAGCGRSAPADTIRISWTLDPSPPTVGTPIVARLTLRDSQQTLVSGARLRLEGLMSHPGMAPIVSTVEDRGDGQYEAPLQFTMAGDWILIVTGELPDGAPITQQIEIAGVRPAQ